MVADLKELPHRDRQKCLNLLTLAYIRIRADMNETVKILTGYYGEDLSQLLCLHKDNVINPDQIHGNRKCYTK